MDDHFSVGLNFFREKDYDRAEYYFRMYLETTECPESYFYLGLISSGLGNVQTALNHYYRSVSLNPEYGNPCNEIGVLLLRMGKDKDAVFWLKKSLRCEKNDAPHISLFNLATLYKIWNRPERSLQYLHKALELAPDFQAALKLREQLQN